MTQQTNITGITCGCSLLVFSLSVSLTLSRVHCLYFSVFQTHNCASLLRLLIVATPVLKQLSEVNCKVTWQQCMWCNYCAHDKWGHTHGPTDVENVKQSYVGPASCTLCTRPAGKNVITCWHEFPYATALTWGRLFVWLARVCCVVMAISVWLSILVKGGQSGKTLWTVCFCVCSNVLMVSFDNDIDFLFFFCGSKFRTSLSEKHKINLVRTNAV